MSMADEAAAVLRDADRPLTQIEIVEELERRGVTFRVQFMWQKTESIGSALRLRAKKLGDVVRLGVEEGCDPRGGKYRVLWTVAP